MNPYMQKEKLSSLLNNNMRFTWHQDKHISKPGPLLYTSSRDPFSTKENPLQNPWRYYEKEHGVMCTTIIFY